MATIILTGGGTAGHCSPNLNLVPLLNKKFNKIIYIGSKNGIEKELVSKTNIPYNSITCAKLKRDFSFDNLKIPFALLKGIKESKRILKQENADIVFSKGGYVALPVIIACKKLKIPVITHESDLSIGLANKIASKYCNLVLTTFPETAKKIKNGKHVGPPLKEINQTINKENVKLKFGIASEKPILLVTGGSLGAKAINECLIKSLPNLLKLFTVIHLCGKNNLRNDIHFEDYKQIEFTSNIHELYSIASVCVSRAGSNTLFELLNEKIPTLVIPLPKNASRGDQILNAQYFYNKKAINLLFQENMNEKSLYDEIIKTYKSSNNLIQNICKLNIKNSCPIIAEILVNYANKLC